MDKQATDNKKNEFLAKFLKKKSAKKDSSITEKVAMATMVFLFGCLVGGYLVGNVLQYMILLENVQSTTSLAYAKTFEAQTRTICGVSSTASIIGATDVKMKQIGDIVEQKIIPATKNNNFAKIAVFGVSKQQSKYYAQIKAIIASESHVNNN